ncbi:MAG: RimK family alpha-L-glutamate ligase [Candidatus Hermodarchaeota archaeon]
MANNVKRIYIGAICNRDLEVLEQLKKFLLKNYNIMIIDLLKKGFNSFDSKYFKRTLKKYPISFLIIKLTTQKINEEIYKAIKQITPNIQILNSLKSIQTCESRKETFKLIAQKCKNLNIPKTYFSSREAFKACKNGKNIIIKLDDHNIPDFPKNGRIIGIARNPNELTEAVKLYNEKDLFFQEYLGEFDIIYKIYVIGRWMVSITSHNRLQDNENLSPLELIHIRVPIDKQLKSRIKRLGRKFGMSVFGLDYIVTEEGTYIIDINDFPSFRSIPEAISLISDHIYNLILLREQYYQTLAKVKVK